MLRVEDWMMVAVIWAAVYVHTEIYATAAMGVLIKVSQGLEMGGFRTEIEKFSALGSMMAHQRAATTNTAGSRANEKGLAETTDRAGSVEPHVAWTTRIAGLRELP
jgi:hypothetical protein